ncbi:MAG: TatD family hydrolase [Actinomycetota bacterium]|nr:TatD family hydrolase [Actinomycetota bacterium]
MNWFDSHCHLEPEIDLADLEVKLKERSVEGLVNIGTTMETSRRAPVVARRVKDAIPELVVGASLGIHPHDGAAVEGDKYREFDELIGVTKEAYPDLLVGIGECGLDYYYDYCDRKVQREAFVAQIESAIKYDLPVIIHTRDAWDDTFAILDDFRHHRYILHCFTGGPSEVERLLGYNTVISFSGVVTFKKSADNQEAAKICPVDRMVVETDSPYLAPMPFRGKPNDPSLVAVTGAFIADLKGIDVDSFAKSTTANALAFFSIPPRD